MGRGLSRKIVKKTDEQEDKAIDAILEGKKLHDVAVAMGLNSRVALQKYLIMFPEFMQRFDRAKFADCARLEEEFEHICDKFRPDYGRNQIEIIRRLLMWRNPQKYGEKQQIDMKMEVDISGALDRAQKRLVDVTPKQIDSKPQDLTPALLELIGNKNKA